MRRSLTWTSTEQACRLGSLRLARDEQTARELHQSAPAGECLPVLLWAEIPRLRGKSPEMLNALLDTKAVFPTAKVLE